MKLTDIFISYNYISRSAKDTYLPCPISTHAIFDFPLESIKLGIIAVIPIGHSCLVCTRWYCYKIGHVILECMQVNFYFILQKKRNNKLLVFVTSFLRRANRRDSGASFFWSFLNSRSYQFNCTSFCFY